MAQQQQMTSAQIRALVKQICTSVIQDMVPDIAQKQIDQAIQKKFGYRSQLALANPKSSIEVATKASAGAGTYLPLSGGTITGNLNMAKVGFNGTAAVNKPTVTGSKASNAALTSLLAALATYGLVVDSST